MGVMPLAGGTCGGLTRKPRGQAYTEESPLGQKKNKKGAGRVTGIKGRGLEDQLQDVHLVIGIR